MLTGVIGGDDGARANASTHAAARDNPIANRNVNSRFIVWCWGCVLLFEFELDQNQAQQRIEIMDQDSGSYVQCPHFSTNFDQMAHQLQKRHFNRPTLCNYCQGFIWGIGKTGLRCERKI